jgi:hypothetical protein
MSKKSKLTQNPNHPWDRARASVLIRKNGVFRNDEPLDTGVNFFVLALEALGAVTRFSCEGHPTGFYVAFEASYELALEIHSAGFFTVEIEGPNYWSIRKTNSERMSEGNHEANKVETLRWATDAWLRTFGNRLAGLDCVKVAA